MPTSRTAQHLFHSVKYRAATFCRITRSEPKDPSHASPYRIPHPGNQRATYEEAHAIMPSACMHNPHHFFPSPLILLLIPRLHPHSTQTNTGIMDEALSSAVLEAVIDPTMVIGEDGVITYFNRAACEAFLIQGDQAIGSKVSTLMANQGDAANHDQYMENYRKTGQKKMIGRNRTVIAKRSDGTTWNASLSISEVTLESKRFFVGTLRDVTASMERERLFSSVIDEAIDAIFTINERGLITLVNRSACRMFGYTEKELIGQNISILMPSQHAHRHDQYIQAHMQTGIQKMIGTDRTVTAKRRDDSEFKCRLGLSKINCTEQGATFVGLLHDLTHELAAREADARAELANKMRKQKALFLASMSHEIRTPLNGIFGMLELLRSTELDEVQTEWLATCSRSAQSLTTILDDILLFSRADGGGITLERLSFNIRDTVEDAVTVLASQTNEKAVDLVYTVSRNVPDRMIGDPTRLRQVMLIFLSNALKFTSVGHVALEVSVDGDVDEDSDDDDSVVHTSGNQSDNEEENANGAVVLKFEVSDTGIGMNKKQIKKLFQPFTQADESTTRQYGGTGLGLSIAKKLVTLMNGEIVVESRPNRGSTFAFTALMEKDPDSTTASDLHDTVPQEDLELLKGTHILSIDDNAVNTDYLINLLKMLGCDVAAARSGVDGIEMCKLAALREDPYEILLLDFAMPGMHGLEVAEIVASSQTIMANKMRTIMLGSIDVHRSIAACPHVHGFTTKPIRRLPLIKMIVEQLKIKRGMLGAPKSKKPRALREDDHEALPDLSSSTRSEVEHSSMNANRPNPLNILYVEDNLINQKVLVTILSQWKCNVTTAVNGIGGFEERIANKGKNSFDLILCDLHMPSCDGFQCVRMIRDWEKKHKIPPVQICAVTADANKETSDLCLSDDGGFNEFLAKPLRKNVLRNMIIKMCGSDRLGSAPANGPSHAYTIPRPTEPEKTPQDDQKESSESSIGGCAHVLVVDDAPTMRLLLRTFLTAMGCRVSEAATGEDAVQIIHDSLQIKDNREPIELVFCDMRMPPGIGGIETTRHIKMLPGAANIPVVGMTADDVTHSELMEARAAGMVSLVSKPIGKSQLTSYLAEHTGTALGKSLYITHQEADACPQWDVAGALDLCGGDPEFLGNLLSDFVVDLATRREELSTSVQRKDCSRAAEITHNIKGMAAICNFKALAQAACDCQKSASASEYVEVRSKSQVVLEEISKAIKLAQDFDPKAW